MKSKLSETLVLKDARNLWDKCYSNRLGDSGSDYFMLDAQTKRQIQVNAADAIPQTSCTHTPQQPGFPLDAHRT